MSLRTLPAVRAYVIQWLKGKGIESRRWLGLDPKRIHFACGCSIVPPHGRARRVPTRAYNPASRTRICSEHRRALGDGTSL